MPADRGRIRHHRGWIVGDLQLTTNIFNHDALTRCIMNRHMDRDGSFEDCLWRAADFDFRQSRLHVFDRGKLRQNVSGELVRPA